jgi:DNA modification methylase
MKKVNKQLKWHIEKRKVKDLKIWEENPRSITPEAFEKLKDRIRKRGFHDVIKIDIDNTILSGNQRKHALEELNMEEVDCIIPNRKLTLEEMQEVAIESNRTDGTWNWDMLANFDEDTLNEAGFEKGELDQIFGLDMAEEFNTEEELNKILKNGVRRVKDGDIWELGNHRLVIGNSTKEANWKKALGKEKFDFMFTDPPYRIGYGIGNRKQKTKKGMVVQKYRTYDTIGLTKKDGKPLDKKSPIIKFGHKGNRSYEGTTQTGGVPEFDEWLSIAKDYQNPKGANVMIFENWKNTVELWQAIEKYWKIKNMIIWHLTNRCQGFSAKYKFFSKYDIAELAGEGPINQEYEEEMDNYLKEKGQKLLDTNEVIIYGNQGKSYWDKKKGTKWAVINDHITWSAQTAASGGQNIVFGTKPLQILVPYIKILSPRDGIVMEPFGGSGSTIIASEIMKRKCRAIELSPTYGEVILSRFERFTGKTAKKLN